MYYTYIHTAGARRRTYSYTYRYGHRGVDGWMRGHDDIQAIYNGMV
jgi:hypothetical protein